MMPSVFNLIQKVLNKSFFKDSSRNKHRPENFVRLCRRRAEFISIVNEAINSPDQHWDDELVHRVVQYILGDRGADISVYAADTLDPFDLGHALAVIAEGIASPDFRENKKKRAIGCNRGSLIIPVAHLPKTTTYQLTPENNLSFYPANDFHYDLTIENAYELAAVILGGIHARKIAWTFLAKNETYQFQAIIVYSHCLKRFGKFDSDNPPSNWIEGRALSIAEQIDTLKYLAQTAIVNSPDPPL